MAATFDIMQKRAELLASLDRGEITRQTFSRRIRALVRRWKKENLPQPETNE